MNIEIPDVLQTMEGILTIHSEYDGREFMIKEWICEHENAISSNMSMVKARSDKNDLLILSIFACDLLMRNMGGETGAKLQRAFLEFVRSKDDLNREKYNKILSKAEYRWGTAIGSAVIADAVKYFRDKLDWNWKDYFDRAEKAKHDNFPDDPILTIRSVGFKVRDLALSNFNPSYPAFDLHITRVMARIGFLAYGWEVIADEKAEFGTNQSDDKNYLFMHRLFLRLSELSKGKFTPVDLDRAFWHLGRTKCGATSECDTCPINKICLTGNRRITRS